VKLADHPVGPRSLEKLRRDRRAGGLAACLCQGAQGCVVGGALLCGKYRRLLVCATGSGVRTRVCRVLALC